MVVPAGGEVRSAPHAGRIEELVPEAVVVQQLLDQVTATLMALSEATGGSLTQAQAASAAASALASTIGATSGTFDLKSVVKHLLTSGELAGVS